jgi:hypothetical protein
MAPPCKPAVFPGTVLEMIVILLPATPVEVELPLIVVSSTSVVPP